MDDKKPTIYIDKRVAAGCQRSFGRVASRMSVAKQEALDARIAPYTLNIIDGKADLSAAEGKKLVLEIGMGNGGLLFHRAQNEPDTHFIGVEVFKNGLKTLVAQVEQTELTNLQMSSEDGRKVMDALPDGCVDMLMVCYPDPWPKRKQRKRRIINADFLKEAARLIKDNGTLFLATDVPEYALWMIREVAAHDGFRINNLSPAEWAEQPSWWTRTKYETKAFKAGRKPWYMTFEKSQERDPDFHRCPPAGDDL